MAVSTADFYTYAKETGTPVAQTPEEKAILYPAVNQWKRSRLNIPRNENEEGVKIFVGEPKFGALEGAAVLGGIIGGGLLGRRYLKDRQLNTKKAPDIVEKGGAGVRTDYTQPRTTEFVEKGGAGVRTDYTQPRTWNEVKERQTPKYTTTEVVETPADNRGVQTVDLNQANYIINPEGEVIPVGTDTETKLLPTKTSKPYSPLDYLIETKVVDPERQYVIDRNLALSDQSINAIDGAEDQRTGRVLQQLQRNEDLDQNQIAVMEEIAEDQDRRFLQGLESGEIAPGKEYQAPIDEVAQSLPDGPPVIPAEQRLGLSNQRFTAPSIGEWETFQYPKALEAQGISGTDLPSYLRNRRESLAAQGYSPEAVEVQLAKELSPAKEGDKPRTKQENIDATRRRQALQMYANEGDIDLLSDERPDLVRTSQGDIVPFDSLREPLVSNSDPDFLQNQLGDVIKGAQEKFDTEMNSDKQWLGDIRVEKMGEMSGIMNERRESLSKIGASLAAEKLNLTEGLERGFVQPQEIGQVRQRIRKLDEELTKARNLYKDPKQFSSHRMFMPEYKKWQPVPSILDRREPEVRDLKGQITRAQDYVKNKRPERLRENTVIQSFDTTTGYDNREQGRNQTGLPPGSTGAMLINPRFPKKVTNTGHGESTQFEVNPETGLPIRSTLERVSGFRKTEPNIVWEYNPETRQQESVYKPAEGSARAVTGFIKEGTQGDVPIPSETGLTLGGNILPNTGSSYYKPTSAKGFVEPYIDRKSGGEKSRIPTEFDPRLNKLSNEQLNEMVLQEGLLTTPTRKVLDPDVSAASQEAERILRSRGDVDALERQAQNLKSVKQAEIIRKLSDPNWLTSAGVDLSKTTPQEQVRRYLNSQGIEQNPLPQTNVVNENVDLRGIPVKREPNVQTSVTHPANLAPSSNYPAAQNQVTYVSPTESTIRSLSVTPSEIEKAERMHLLNYISAAHGQIKGGARAGGTKMRNNLTPYQAPSDAMLNQLVMKRRMERI